MYRHVVVGEVGGAVKAIRTLEVVAGLEVEADACYLAQCGEVKLLPLGGHHNPFAEHVGDAARGVALGVVARGHDVELGLFGGGRREAIAKRQRVEHIAGVGDPHVVNHARLTIHKGYGCQRGVVYRGVEAILVAVVDAEVRRVVVAMNGYRELKLVPTVVALGQGGVILDDVVRDGVA